MWIELPDKTYELIRDIKNPYNENITAINALFDSMRRCQHIIFANDNVLKLLQQHSLINPTNKEFITYIRQKYVYIYECFDYIKYRIIVDYENECVTRDDNTFFVPIKYLEEIREAKLLAENENDGNMFCNIYQQINKMKKMSPTFFIRYENDSFHGGNAPSKIKQATQDNRIILCLVDSDKDYIGCARGCTSAGAHKAYNKVKNNHVINIYELGVRERENLFPPILYKVITHNHQKLLDIVDEHIDIEDFIKYIDIKDGVKYKKYDLFEKENGNNKWDVMYKNFIERCKAEDLFEEPETDQSDFKCIKGIGPNLCDLLNDILLEPDKYKFEINFHTHCIPNRDKGKIMQVRNNLLELIPDYLLDEWNRIYELLFSWGCCLSRNALPIYQDHYME